MRRLLSALIFALLFAIAALFVVSAVALRRVELCMGAGVSALAMSCWMGRTCCR